MTTDPMPEPEGPEDERFVYVVTAAGVEALREGAAAFDSERETLLPSGVEARDVRAHRREGSPSPGKA